MTPLFSKTRCTGHCCREFPIFGSVSGRISPEQIRAMYDAASPDDPNRNDYLFISEMLIPIVGPSPTKPDVVRKLEDGFYTCKHFDGTSCTQYDHRPQMCRQYPYGRKCDHGDSCTWKEGEIVTKLERQRTDRGLLAHIPEPCTDGLFQIQRKHTSLEKAFAKGTIP